MRQQYIYIYIYCERESGNSLCMVRPRAFFLATRPEARTYKSDVTRSAIH